MVEGLFGNEVNGCSDASQIAWEISKRTLRWGLRAASRHQSVSISNAELVVI